MAATPSWAARASSAAEASHVRPPDQHGQSIVGDTIAHKVGLPPQSRALRRPAPATSQATRPKSTGPLSGAEREPKGQADPDGDRSTEQGDRRPVRPTTAEPGRLFGVLRHGPRRRLAIHSRITLRSLPWARTVDPAHPRRRSRRAAGCSAANLAMTPLLWVGFGLMGVFTVILAVGLLIEERAIRSPRLYEDSELSLRDHHS